MRNSSRVRRECTVYLKREGKLTMTSRREFLNLAMKGSALTAAAALMPGGPLAARNANEKAATNAAQNAANTSPQRHYKPPFKFGMGGVPLGNEFSMLLSS